MTVKRDLVVDNIHSSGPPGDEVGSLVIRVFIILA